MTQHGPPLESEIYDQTPPPSSSTTAPPPPTQEQPAPAPAEEQSPLDRAVDPFPEEFPAGHREGFGGLLLLGRLEHYFEWAGHRFRIKTCLPFELAEASRWAARYAGTDGYVKAYQAAIIAACTLSIDGRPLPAVPLSEDESAIEANADWVFRKLFPPTLDKVHEEYVLLEFKARQILASMGKASG